MCGQKAPGGVVRVVACAHQRESEDRLRGSSKEGKKDLKHKEKVFQLENPSDLCWFSPVELEEKRRSMTGPSEGKAPDQVHPDDHRTHAADRARAAHRRGQCSMGK